MHHEIAHILAQTFPCILQSRTQSLRANGSIECAQTDIKDAHYEKPSNDMLPHRAHNFRHPIVPIECKFHGARGNAVTQSQQNINKNNNHAPTEKYKWKNESHECTSRGKNVCFFINVCEMHKKWSKNFGHLQKWCVFLHWVPQTTLSIVLLLLGLLGRECENADAWFWYEECVCVFVAYRAYKRTRVQRQRFIQ